MRGFRFDARAALAEIEKEQGAAIPAIVAIVGAQAPQAVDIVDEPKGKTLATRCESFAIVAPPAKTLAEQSQPVARVFADIAKQEQAISKTIVTIATIATPKLDDFCERAAIVEYDGGLSRAGAEAMAAQAQGYLDAEALRVAATGAWLHRLNALEAQAGQVRYIANARAFTANGWAAQAIALGWRELALFGLCPKKPWARFDRMGAAWFGEARAISAEAIVYRTGNRLLHTRQAHGAQLPWDLAGL